MLDKLDELVDAVKNLTINDAKYYESNTATASDPQEYLTRNLETVTHTSNRNFEQNILIYQIILSCLHQKTPGFTKGLW